MFKITCYVTCYVFHPNPSFMSRPPPLTGSGVLLIQGCPQSSWAESRSITVKPATDGSLMKAEPPRINPWQLCTPLSLKYSPTAQWVRLIGWHESLTTRNLLSPVGSFHQKTYHLIHSLRRSAHRQVYIIGIIIFFPFYSFLLYLMKK